MRHTLHHSIVGAEEVLTIKFDTIQDMYSYLDTVYNLEDLIEDDVKDTVFLVGIHDCIHVCPSYDDGTSAFISDFVYHIDDMEKDGDEHEFIEDAEIYLFEFETYEEAFKVALGWCEDKPNCYN